MIRLLADENISVESVRLLREAGYNVAAVREDCPGADDAFVLSLAHVWRAGSCSRSTVTSANWYSAARAPRRRRALPIHAALAGHFTVVSDDHDRPVKQRRMPGVRPDT